MAVAILILYGLFLLIAISNLLLMRMPGLLEEGDTFCILIPARNEADNLRELLPRLTSQEGGAPKIYVFDDESDDGTAVVAASLGATVIRPREPLPEGWAGKNRACHELAKAAIEDSNADWYLFLDADVRPEPWFLSGMRGLAKAVGGRVGVLTGFGQMLSGRGPEPLFLAWVGWILLCTNPFGLVSRTRLGHNGFTNGQIHAWRADVYPRIWPNEQVKGRLMEDVAMGRLLAKQGVRVEVANLAHLFSVRMYNTWRQTLDGMSKNSFEITGSYAGSIVLAAFFWFLATGWLFAGESKWIALGLLVLSSYVVATIVDAVVWPAFLTPVALFIGGYTILRSAWWKHTGQTRWKGRTYQ